jgi:hypothetical protein
MINQFLRIDNMKKEERTRILKRLVSLIILISVGLLAKAQDQTVSVSSSYTYSVVQSLTGSTFTWTINGGANGTDYIYTPSNTNSLQITWLNTGYFVIHVTEVSSHGCTNPSSPSAFQVNVIAKATIAFATTSSASCSGASGTDLTVNLTFTGTPVYPIIVNYTIDGSAYSRTINSGTSISLGSEANILVNNTAADVIKTITITSATSHGSSLNIGANKTYSYTVYATPQLNPISHD